MSNPFSSRAATGILVGQTDSIKQKRQNLVNCGPMSEVKKFQEGNTKQQMIYKSCIHMYVDTFFC